MINYEQIIDEIVKTRNLDLEEVLTREKDEVVTLRDFIVKSKKMTPWHKRLADNLCDIQAENGNILKYLREYTEDKIKSGFSFTEKTKLRDKSEMQEACADSEGK